MAEQVRAAGGTSPGTVGKGGKRVRVEARRDGGDKEEARPGQPCSQRSPCIDLVARRRAEADRAEEGGAAAVGGAAGANLWVRAGHSPTQSGRKRQGGAGGCGGGGARGDVRGGAARAGGGGSVCGTRVEVGRSELLGPAASAGQGRRASPRETPVALPSSQPARTVRSSPLLGRTPSAASRRFPLGRFPPASSCSPLKLQR